MLLVLMMIRMAAGIIGGNNAKIVEHPYHVAILDKRYKLTCGSGSLITMDSVLTAARCLYSMPFEIMNTLKVQAGTEYIGRGRGNFRDVKKMSHHPRFSLFENDYDVCVLFLSSPFNYKSTIKPVKLVSVDEYLFPNNANVTGWGIHYKIDEVLSDPLQVASLPIVSSSLCEFLYGNLTPRMLCCGDLRGHMSVCSGDVGDPLMFMNEQIGIASVVSHCDTALSPGVYVNVANKEIREYIDQCIEDDE